jgi:hypothetical protein
MLSGWTYAGTSTETMERNRERKRLTVTDPARVFSFHRTCIMHLYRQLIGHVDPSCCKSAFWTNRPTKITCCTECSLDWGAIAPDFKRKLPEAAQRLMASALGGTDAPR